MGLIYKTFNDIFPVYKIFKENLKYEMFIFLLIFFSSPDQYLGPHHVVSPGENHQPGRSH